MPDCTTTELGEERFSSAYTDIYFDDATWDEVRDDLFDEGHEYVGRGTDRMVFRGTDETIVGGDECVVKIPINYAGTQQNQNEYYQQDEYDYLLDIHDKGTGWITMPYVNEVPTSDFSEFFQEVTDKHDEVPNDFAQANCGITDNGEVVCLDYGRGFQRTETL